MQSKFHIGQKVICIKEFKSPKIDFEIYPTKGEPYTVRGIECTKGIIYITLNEIRNLFYDYDGDFGECTFIESHFAPVADTKIEWSELAEKELILN